MFFLFESSSPGSLERGNPWLLCWEQQLARLAEESKWPRAMQPPRWCASRRAATVVLCISESVSLFGGHIRRCPSTRPQRIAPRSVLSTPSFVSSSSAASFEVAPIVTHAMIRLMLQALPTALRSNHFEFLVSMVPFGSRLIDGQLGYSSIGWPPWWDAYTQQSASAVLQCLYQPSLLSWKDRRRIRFDAQIAGGLLKRLRRGLWVLSSISRKRAAGLGWLDQ